MKKFAQVKWGRGKFSEVFRSTIIDPSPIKAGKKVKVLWGETRKEYVTLHGKTVNKVIARARHGPNTFARYLSNTLSVRICKKKQKK